MKLRRIKEILHVCEKTIDNYANRIGASDEIVEYIENLQSQLKAKEEAEKEFKDWLEDNWKQSQDIWFVKIINKMQELEQGKDE